MVSDLCFHLRDVQPKIDYMMRMVEGEHGFSTMPRRSTRHPEEVIDDLNFADNIDLLENSLQGLAACTSPA